jgi:hypothetical protein
VALEPEENLQTGGDAYLHLASQNMYQVVEAAAPREAGIVGNLDIHLEGNKLEFDCQNSEVNKLYC